jgi:hypothetical protein
LIARLLWVPFRPASAPRRYGSHFVKSAGRFVDQMRGRGCRACHCRRYDGDPAPLRAAKRAAQPAFDEAFRLFDAGDANLARAAFERCRQLLPDDPIAALHLAPLRREG